ncbi:hypothetical protein CLOM_g14873 [Closterium sp. NIES-68]|nr:hypothetical protein CLOM_g14873 [Closterium sp. NIES-68]
MDSKRLAYPDGVKLLGRETPQYLHRGNPPNQKEPQKSIGRHQFRAYSGGTFSRGPGAAHFSAPRNVEA